MCTYTKQLLPPKIQRIPQPSTQRPVAEDRGHGQMKAGQGQAFKALAQPANLHATALSRPQGSGTLPKRTPWTANLATGDPPTNLLSCPSKGYHHFQDYPGHPLPLVPLMPHPHLSSPIHSPPCIALHSLSLCPPLRDPPPNSTAALSLQSQCDLRVADRHTRGPKPYPCSQSPVRKGPDSLPDPPLSQPLT